MGAMGLDALRTQMKTATLRRKIDVSSPWLSIFQFDLLEPCHFKPGQYVNLDLETAAELPPKPYSIASSPYESKFLEFYINLVDKGELSPHLLALKPGDVIRYGHPGGNFTLERTHRRDLVMVASGTGLAPFVSMVRKLKFECSANGRSDYSVIVMHGVSHTQDLGYRAELEAWSRQEDLQLFYLPTISRPETDPDFTRQQTQGRVNDLLRHFLGEPKTGPVEPLPGIQVDVERIKGLLCPSSAFFICGNPEMIADCRAALHSRGLTEVFTEEYW